MSTTLQSQLQAVRNAVNTAGTPATRLDDALRIVAQVAEPPKGVQIAEFLDLILNSPSQFLKDPATWVPSNRQRDALFAILGAPGQPVQSAQGTKPYPPYDVGGLLNVNRETVWFKKLHRGLIALQLVIRVADPKRIEQKQHPLCGPTVLIKSFARNYPEEYCNM